MEALAHAVPIWSRATDSRSVAAACWRRSRKPIHHVFSENSRTPFLTKLFQPRVRWFFLTLPNSKTAAGVPFKQARQAAGVLPLDEASGSDDRPSFRSRVESSTVEAVALNAHNADP